MVWPFPFEVYSFSCCCIAVSLDPDDEKLLEEEPINLPDKKRYEYICSLPWYLMSYSFILNLTLVQKTINYGVYQPWPLLLKKSASLDNGTWAFAVYTCSVHFVLSILFEHSDSDCLPLNHWYHPSKVYMKITWKCSQLLLGYVWLTRFCNRNTFWTILEDQKRVFHFQNCSYGPKSCFWCQWQCTGNIVRKPSQQLAFLNKALVIHSFNR